MACAHCPQGRVGAGPVRPAVTGRERLERAGNHAYELEWDGESLRVSRDGVVITCRGPDPFEVAWAGAIHELFAELLDPFDEEEHRAQVRAVACRWLREHPPVEQPRTTLALTELCAWARAVLQADRLDDAG